MLPVFVVNRRTAVVVGLVGICLFTVQAALASPYKSQTAKMDTRKTAADSAGNQPVVLKGDVAAYGPLTDDVQDALGLACMKEGHLTKITLVRPASEASFKGLRVGDEILDARIKDGLVSIGIKRAGQVYAAQLSLYPQKPAAGSSYLPSARYAAGTPQADEFAGQPFQLRAGQLSGYVIDSTDIAALSKYNFELIIDRSMSMRVRDCPDRLSRWDWCSRQAIEIASALSPYAPKGITVSRFAGQFDAHEKVNPAMAAELLSRKDFQFGTRMNDPLAARLEKHFRTHRPGDKPLLLVVISDGVPFPRDQPRLVVETLVNASQRMKTAGEIAVVFLQVGANDPRGQRYLTDLGSNLVSHGARFQYVHTQTFDQLQSVGLAKAITAAVSQGLPATTSIASGTPLSGGRIRKALRRRMF